jgi:hypothetical protein
LSLICNQCNNEITDNEKFCRHCGRRVQSTKKHRNWWKYIAITLAAFVILIFIIAYNWTEPSTTASNSNSSDELITTSINSGTGDVDMSKNFHYLNSSFILSCSTYKNLSTGTLRLTLLFNSTINNDEHKSDDFYYKTGGPYKHFPNNMLLVNVPSLQMQIRLLDSNGNVLKEFYSEKFSDIFGYSDLDKQILNHINDIQSLSFNIDAITLQDVKSAKVGLCFQY